MNRANKIVHIFDQARLSLRRIRINLLCNHNLQPVPEYLSHASETPGEREMVQNFDMLKAAKGEK
jgi:hypothetical protein